MIITILVITTYAIFLLLKNRGLKKSISQLQSDYEAFRASSMKELTEVKESLEDALAISSILKDPTKARTVQPGNKRLQPRKLVRPESMAPVEAFKPNAKRKNIQPGNIGLVPLGTIMDDELKEIREIYSTSNTTIEYKFFGTQLEVGGRVLINGLPRKLHQLEVVQGKLYIDGKEIAAHPNDVDALIKQIKEQK